MPWNEQCAIENTEQKLYALACIKTCLPQSKMVILQANHLSQMLLKTESAPDATAIVCITEHNLFVIEKERHTAKLILSLFGVWFGKGR